MKLNAMAGLWLAMTGTTEMTTEVVMGMAESARPERGFLTPTRAGGIYA